MSRHLATRLAVGIAVSAAVIPVATVTSPVSAAAPCADVDVVFARGTTEPPGVGGIGQAFVDAVRAQTGDRSVSVYAVNYPASNDFGSSTPAGADDATAHIRSMISDCPSTRMVLGGYSQGAAVIELATNAAPPDAVDHVAAAALFGSPRSAFADTLSAGPLPVVAPAYTGKTIDLCAPNDLICETGGWDWAAHGAYARNGMVQQAAAYAAGRL
jgi:cutinase